MKHLVLFFTLFAVAACTNMRDTSSIRSADHIVIPSQWNPDEAVVAQCERVVGRAVAKEGKAYPKSGTHCRLGSYYVRMYAVVVDGKPALHGYGCATDEPGAGSYVFPERNPNPDHETILLQPFGGGLRYFQFTYDCRSGKLTEFQFGAPL